MSWSELLNKIIVNLLTALYQPFCFSLLLAFCFMFFYMAASCSIPTGKGWKWAAQE